MPPGSNNLAGVGGAGGIGGGGSVVSVETSVRSVALFAHKLSQKKKQVLSCSGRVGGVGIRSLF